MKADCQERHKRLYLKIGRRARLLAVRRARPHHPGTVRGERVFIIVEPSGPVPLHRITLADLMASPSATPEMERSVYAAVADPTYVDEIVRWNPVARLAEKAEDWQVRDNPVDFPVPGFVCCVPRHVGRLPLMAVYHAGTGELVGGLHDKNIVVVPGYRGLGIGSEILVLAFELGMRHPDEMNFGNTLTTAGRANRVAAHRLAVTRALDAGEDVPGEVLEDYPELSGGPGPPC